MLFNLNIFYSFSSSFYNSFLIKVTFLCASAYYIPNMTYKAGNVVVNSSTF